MHAVMRDGALHDVIDLLIHVRQELLVRLIFILRPVGLMRRQADPPTITADHADPLGAALIPGQITLCGQREVENKLLHAAFCHSD